MFLVATVYVVQSQPRLQYLSQVRHFSSKKDATSGNSGSSSGSGDVGDTKKSAGSAVGGAGGSAGGKGSGGNGDKKWRCPKCGDPCTHVDTFVCK